MNRFEKWTPAKQREARDALGILRRDLQPMTAEEFRKRQDYLASFAPDGILPNLALADILGVTPANVARWRNGQNIPRPVALAMRLLVQQAIHHDNKQKDRRNQHAEDQQQA